MKNPPSCETCKSETVSSRMYCDEKETVHFFAAARNAVGAQRLRESTCYTLS